MALDHYRDLSCQVREKYQDASLKFEEHFLWLQEVVVAAKHSFAHREPALLPKTPATKRGRKKKAPKELDEGESPSKRASIESTSQTVLDSPELPPPRRARAASRLAQERVAKINKESNRRKLRRPSTPIEEVRAVKKTRNTRRGKESQESVEITEYALKGNDVEDEEVPEEKSRDRLAVDGGVPDKEEVEETPKKETQELCRRSTSIGKKLKFTGSSSEENIPTLKTESSTKNENDQIEDTNVTFVKDDSKKLMETTEYKDCSVILDDVLKESKYSLEINPKKSSKGSISNSHTDSDKRDSGIEGQEDEEQHSEKQRTHCESPKGEDNDENKEFVSRAEDEENAGSQKGPVPKVRSTRTKQKEVVMEQPVPRPRTTRTKQRLDSPVTESPGESETDSGLPSVTGSRCASEEEEEEEREMLPPPDIPKIKSTRTKKLNDSTASQQSLSESESTAEDDSHSQSSRSSFGTSGAHKARSTRTKKKQTDECFNEREVPKSRSTRTKKRAVEGSTVESMIEDSSLHSRSEESSLKKEETLGTSHTSEPLVKAPASDVEMITDESDADKFHPPEAPKARSTRTKKKQPDESISSEIVPKSRSTRTKKKMDEQSASSSVTEDLVSESENIPTDSSNSRSTRTKKRQVDQEGNQPTRSTRTKRRKYGEEEEESDKENNLKNIQSSSPRSKALLLIQKYQAAAGITAEEHKKEPTKPTNHRITRSKVRQVPASKVSPVKGSPLHVHNLMSPASKRDFQRECCSPKSDSGSAQNKQRVISRVNSPVRSPHPYKNGKGHHAGVSSQSPFQKGGLSEVEEISSKEIEVIKSPARVTRHSGGKSAKSPDTRWARINPTARTPSPQCPPEKIVRPKMGHILNSNSSYGSSGRITPKTYSRIRPGLKNSANSSSAEYQKTQKKINTPNDAKRTKNIVTGVTSFIKVQAPKPTREDQEAKRLMELQKKREKEDDIRKKKEELLKSRAEDQKRRNEERMRRVKEAREEKERKAEEAKELQKKQREEQLKKQQQQQLLAKKQAEEEAKARKLKEQMEEERRRQEIRLAEETRKAEEAKKAEAERLEEEKRKLKKAEAERIAREKKEIEQLKLREAERALANKKAAGTAKLEETFTKDSSGNKANANNHNATFTKTNSNSNSGNESTPDGSKTPKKITGKNPNNYNIHDIKSDDSTDDETAPKQAIPAWAQGSQLKMALINQEYYPPNIVAIFPPEELLTMPDLMQIFPIARRRFFKRTSSAIWNTPPGRLID